MTLNVYPLLGKLEYEPVGIIVKLHKCSKQLSPLLVGENAAETTRPQINITVEIILYKTMLNIIPLVFEMR